MKLESRKDLNGAIEDGNCIDTVCDGSKKLKFRIRLKLWDLETTDDRNWEGTEKEESKGF